MTHDCPGHNFPCLTRKCYIPNIGWASYKDVADDIRRYGVIFLGFQMLNTGCEQTTTTNDHNGALNATMVYQSACPWSCDGSRSASVDVFTSLGLKDVPSPNSVNYFTRMKLALYENPTKKNRPEIRPNRPTLVHSILA